MENQRKERIYDARARVAPYISPILSHTVGGGSCEYMLSFVLKTYGCRKSALLKEMQTRKIYSTDDSHALLHAKCILVSLEPEPIKDVPSMTFLR